MAAVGPVIARKRARTSRETVWTYFADPALLGAWWPDASLTAVLGGAVSEQWVDGDGEAAASRNAVGVIDVLIAGHALGFRWRDGNDEHETAVLMTLRSHGAETEVMVTETGFGRFADAFERTADAQQSWIDLLEALAAVLPEELPEESPEALPAEIQAEIQAEPEASAAPEPADPDSEESGTADPNTA